MHELERIEYTLANDDLDPAVFERCAQDLLTETYPGLSPVPGGTDWGRDADVHDGAESPPPRLMVTKSREFSGIRSNMIGGLESLKQHSVPFERIVIANLGTLNETQRSKLRREAATHGARLEAVYDRGFFASRLRRDGEWRRRLLGLSGDPITVSRMPWRLAESPWSQLPLVGRDEVLDQLRASDKDVILIGRPGVGKTRLLAAVPDVIFVDPDAAEDRLADDIRWVRPGVVVIDDVGLTPGLARFVQRLRRQEADWLRIRLIAVCWPDEIETIRDLLPGADEIELDLLERPAIDSIVEAMGITAVIARQEILDQAEGRPGWAVAVGDLLLRSGWEDLVTGKAILGQVDGYLRRSQLSVSARDLLAVAAALRGLDERDLSAVARAVGVSRSDAGRLLRVVAQGGLLDVREVRTPEGASRHYLVRPPMLADAVATEHYLLGHIPLGDIDELLGAWPERLVDVVITVCTAARLGSDRARALADGLVHRALEDNLQPDVVRLVYENYLLIDEQSAETVIKWLEDEFSRLDEDGKEEAYGLQPLVELAYLAAVRYLHADAVRLMLEMAVYDRRETNPNPEHPLRKLADLCTRVHPDLPRTADYRILVASVLTEFLPDQPTDAQWPAWVAVAEAVLTPHARGTFSAPEDMFRVTIFETIVTPEHAKLIHERLWPLVRDRLKMAPTYVVAQIVSVVHEWLRVGGGYDHPFGRGHPEEAVACAQDIGRAMLDDLIALCRGKPGLVARLMDTASMFDIDLPESFVADVSGDPFFRDVDRADDWRAAIEALRADINAYVAGWEAEPPEQVVERLREILAELQASGQLWPDRVRMACQAIADRADDLVPWVQSSLHQGLFPDAAPYLTRLVSRQSPDARSIVEQCVSDPVARRDALSAVLADSRDDDLVAFAVSQLTSADYGLMDVLVTRNELDPTVQLRLLRDAPPPARGAFAVALAGRTDDPQESIPDELQDGFLAAVKEIRPAELNRRADYQLIRLLQFMAEHYPDTAEQLVRERIEEAKGGGLFEALGYDVWRALHVLPRENRTSLLRTFSAPGVRWFLFEHLVGPDAEWLEEILNAEVVSPEEALGARGFHGRIAIDRMAQLLVPRGIEPARIASLAFSGSWTGEQSARYQQLVDQFASYAGSDDPSVAAVGKAGVDVFTKARDEALERERQRRIRGGR